MGLVGLVTVRVSDNLPVFAFVGGYWGADGALGEGGRRKLVNEGRIARFARALDAWSFNKVWELGVEGNVAIFQNSFQDTYDVAFSLVGGKKSRRDERKPGWVMRKLMRKKGELYSRKVKGLLDKEGQGRLVNVYRELNARRSL